MMLNKCPAGSTIVLFESGDSLQKGGAICIYIVYIEQRR